MDDIRERQGRGGRSTEGALPREQETKGEQRFEMVRHRQAERICEGRRDQGDANNHLAFSQKVIYKLGNPSSSCEGTLGRHGVTVVCSVPHKDTGMVIGNRVVGSQEGHTAELRGDNVQGGEVGQ